MGATNIQKELLSREDLLLAKHRVNDFVHNTPILTSTFLNKLSGANLYFKCENFQKIGAFKARGAFNVLLQLDKNKTPVLCTHSSGNHAQALAYAAKTLGFEAIIVMPNNAPAIKIEAVKGYGAKVVLCEPGQANRQAMLDKVQIENKAFFVPPYNHLGIIAGQATACMELLEEQELDFILCPVGGGGLTAGTALAAHYFSKNTQVIACEPNGANDAYRSFKSGVLVTEQTPKTIADGLLTTLGEINFGIIKKHVHDILCVEEESIQEALALILERLKIVVEPSSAVPLATILSHNKLFRGKSVGIILSGGNIDLKELHKILA